MRLSWLSASTAIFSLVATAGAAMAQTQVPTTTTPAGAVGSGPPDPLTIAALERMGTALRELTSFSVDADIVEEKVLETGQKIQLTGEVNTRARRPNLLRIDRVSDRQARNLYFDGKSITIYSPRLGFYASAPAEGTINEAVAAVAAKYQIETPLADLFSWGADPSSVARIQSAFYVGAETIGGIACDQYALREEGTDWQVWIRQKGQPLPCKLVIVATDQPSLPQYSAVFSWTPQQAHSASTFAFTPPKGSHRIAITAPVEPSPASAQ